MSIVLTTKRVMKVTKVTERRRLTWSWTKALVGKKQCTELDAFPAFAWKVLAQHL